MTNEMERLFSKLHTINVKNIVGASTYLIDEIEKMDMEGTLDFELKPNLLKSVKKELKILKKIYKGKLDIEPRSVYVKYEENTQEHFFLKCLIDLMKHNA